VADTYYVGNPSWTFANGYSLGAKLGFVRSKHRHHQLGQTAQPSVCDAARFNDINVSPGAILKDQSSKSLSLFKQFHADTFVETGIARPISLRRSGNSPNSIASDNRKQAVPAYRRNSATPALGIKSKLRKSPRRTAPPLRIHSVIIRQIKKRRLSRTQCGNLNAPRKRKRPRHAHLPANFTCRRKFRIQTNQPG